MTIEESKKYGENMDASQLARNGKMFIFHFTMYQTMQKLISNYVR